MKYQELRDALNANLKPSPWTIGRNHRGTNTFIVGPIKASYSSCAPVLDVSQEDARFVCAANPDTLRALLAELDAKTEALAGLVDDIDGLTGESDGVAGLHLNGDLAPWDELLPSGRFERLTSLDAARAALSQGEQTCGS